MKNLTQQIANKPYFILAFLVGSILLGFGFTSVNANQEKEEVQAQTIISFEHEPDTYDQSDICLEPEEKMEQPKELVIEQKIVPVALNYTNNSDPSLGERIRTIKVKNKKAKKLLNKVSRSGSKFGLSKTANNRVNVNLTKEEFISKYKSMAIEEMERTKIPASITLAQAILESNWGKSSIAIRSNNYFCIKCSDSWKGQSYYHKDDDRKRGRLVKSCFRLYDSPHQSFVDHSDFLMKQPRYKDLFLLSTQDYKGWAEGLKKAGYATDPGYATKLIQVIEDYDLSQFDMQGNQDGLMAGFGF